MAKTKVRTQPNWTRGQRRTAKLQSSIARKNMIAAAKAKSPGKALELEEKKHVQTQKTLRTTAVANSIAESMKARSRDDGLDVWNSVINNSTSGANQDNAVSEVNPRG